MSGISLGDKVKCIHTGFVGIAVARTEFINGCIQFNVLPKGDTKNKMPEDMGIDEQSLEIVSTKRKKKAIKRNTGGAMTRDMKRRNY